MKIIKRILLALIIIIGIAIYVNYPKLNIISGYASKNLTSNALISKRSVASITANDNNMPLIKMADVTFNEKDKIGSATVFGLMERKTVYREGLGCVLVNDSFDASKMTLKPERNKVIDTLLYPFGHNEPLDTIFTSVDYKQLNKAVDFAFSNPEVHKTRTVLVLHQNRIIAEKYADGFSKETPILGWSMTKSIIATLYGTLEHEGKININSSTSIPEWQNDERKNITINHLLRMQSGLEWEEDYTKISDVIKMLYLDADMTQAQRDKKAIAKPTEIWNYSSGTSNLLSGILRDQFSSRQEYLDYPYKALIDKIGMNSMLLEADMEGNYVGSSYGWATTRDWGKFGTLYLNNGNWNGKQLFSKDWVKYITKPTKNSDGVYGAHFWLNAGGKFPDVPKDMYSANGFQGQRVFIIPSKNLVVVRTGLEQDPIFDINTFLSGIAKSID
ncbi:serine hydrolase domain-containing protein [Maribacter vaceletii]|uniref:serine hydrolase domain-containing protein n=1 Tax=Maribacter vaceletii TaxID=1206816 RepID=UPI001FE9D973|nr:serine hydrolase [Maribacter vaceletii]